MLLLGCFVIGWIGTANVQAMEIEDPKESFGNSLGQCWGQGTGDDYTIKYKTGLGETSHSVQVEAIINKDGKFSYKKILDKFTVPYPDGVPGREKTIEVRDKWPTNGDWVLVSSWYVFNLQEHNNGVVVCQTKNSKASPLTMKTEVNEGGRDVSTMKPEVIIVQPGETLSELSQKYGLSVQELVEINGISDPNNITVGQELVLPSGH